MGRFGTTHICIPGRPRPCARTGVATSSRAGSIARALLRGPKGGSSTVAGVCLTTPSRASVSADAAPRQPAGDAGSRRFAAGARRRRVRGNCVFRRSVEESETSKRNRGKFVFKSVRVTGPNLRSCHKESAISPDHSRAPPTKSFPEDGDIGDPSEPGGRRKSPAARFDAQARVPNLEILSGFRPSE